MKQILNEKVEFSGATILLPTLSELNGVRVTVETLLETCDSQIIEIFLIVSTSTEALVLEECDALALRNPEKVSVLKQQRPGLGGSLRTGIALARGSHTVIMFTDLESDPKAVSSLLQAAKNSPANIVSMSRWRKTSEFAGYPPVKKLLNFSCQKILGTLFTSAISDFTFGFRIYPTKLLQGIPWTEEGHGFILESLLIPIRLHIPVDELPCVWRKRQEGISHAKTFYFFRYLWLALKIRFRIFADNNNVIPTKPFEEAGGKLPQPLVYPASPKV